MTPEKQRVVIAEACGWQRCYVNSDEFYGVNPNGIYTIMPNYPFSLNAMHDAEKFILSTDLYIQYVNYLFRSVGLNRTYYMGATPEVFPADRQFAVFHATAAQRAEAFLRTIGKWEEAL